MTSNWERLSKPPREALKTIAGGRLKGMTDVNPQWRYKAMTDVYGACGGMWGYSIDKLWLEDGVEGEKVAFAQVSVWAGDTVAKIPGIGGSMLIAREKDRDGGGTKLRTNDEAYKMAVTDALSVALKMLGVASAIYEGRWDGTKYRDTPMEKITPNAGAGEDLTEKQRDKVDKLASNVIDMFEAQIEVKEIFNMIELALLDNPEKLFLWTYLDAPMRSALKAYGAAVKASDMKGKA